MTIAVAMGKRVKGTLGKWHQGRQERQETSEANVVGSLRRFLKNDLLEWDKLGKLGQG
jgi:hypothetical protein